MSSAELYVEGQVLAFVGQWGELKWSHMSDGGCHEASWKMDLPLTFAHPLLTRGKEVEIRVGPANVWAGIITEIEPNDDWAISAIGLFRLGGDYLALDGSGNTTVNVNTAIDQAVSRGLPWIRRQDMGNAPSASTSGTDALNNVRDTMLAWAGSYDQPVRCYVGPYGEIRGTYLPGGPSYYMNSDVGRFGLADDEYASDIFIRYLTTSGTYATATVGDASARGRFGRREEPVDITSLGPQSLTQAQAVGTNLLGAGKARMGWTSGVTVNKWQLTTTGGVPASLPFVEAGAMVRMFGVVDDQGQPTNYIDWIIGQTEYAAGSDTIDLMPLGLVPRVLSDVLSIGGGDD